MVEELETLAYDLAIDSIIKNRNPYFFYKNPDAYYEIKIKKVINQLSYADMNKTNLLKRAMKNTKLSEERCIEIIKKVRPDLNF
jgi:hypothetical protein